MFYSYMCFQFLMSTFVNTCICAIDVCTGSCLRWQLA